MMHSDVQALYATVHDNLITATTNPALYMFYSHKKEIIDGLLFFRTISGSTCTLSSTDRPKKYLQSSSNWIFPGSASQTGCTIDDQFLFGLQRVIEFNTLMNPSELMVCWCISDQLQHNHVLLVVSSKSNRLTGSLHLWGLNFHFFSDIV